MTRCILVAGLVILAAHAVGTPMPADADSTQRQNLAVSLWPPEIVTLGLVWTPQVSVGDPKGLGLGVDTVLPYRLDRDPDVKPSALGFSVMGTVKGQWRVQLENDLRWSDGRYYARFRLEHDNLARYFYGIGPTAARDRRETYKPQSSLAYLEGSVRLAPHIALGPRLEIHHQAVHDLQLGGVLDRGEVPGTESSAAVGAGLVGQWDTRDCLLQPCRGVFVQGLFMAFSPVLGTHRFTVRNLDGRVYLPVKDRHILALQAFYYSVHGEPPFWRLAALGGRDHSRAYRRDRWLDDVLVATQAEWRWQVSSRIGLVALAGAAVVGERFASLEARHLRPSLGMGLRIYIDRERLTVPVRLDVVAGTGRIRAVLAVGEAF